MMTKLGLYKITTRNLFRLVPVTTLVCLMWGGAVGQQWTTNGNNINNTNTGNVGIGTTTPDTDANLHISKGPSAGIDVQSTDTGGWARLRLRTGTRTYGWFAGDASQQGAPNMIGLYD